MFVSFEELDKRDFRFKVCQLFPYANPLPRTETTIHICRQIIQFTIAPSVWIEFVRIFEIFLVEIVACLHNIHISPFLDLDSMKIVISHCFSWEKSNSWSIKPRCLFLNLVNVGHFL